MPPESHPSRTKKGRVVGEVPKVLQLEGDDV